jgi:hypothetical protein
MESHHLEGRTLAAATETLGRAATPHCLQNTTHYLMHVFDWGVLLVKPLLLEQETPRGPLHGMYLCL